MILLARPYGGYAAGAVAELPSSTEAALVAQGFGTISAGPISTGAVTVNGTAGTVAIAAGASSVVVTNANVDASSKVYAVVAQAAADGTLLRVERIVPAAGSFTIFGTANATATTLIDWCVLSQQIPPSL